MRWTLKVGRDNNQKVGDLIIKLGFKIEKSIDPTLVIFSDFGNGSVLTADEVKFFIENSIERPRGWATVYEKLIQKITDREVLFLLENSQIYNSDQT